MPAMPALPDSRAVRALLSLGMVVGLGATGTYAYWTDQVQVSGTTITTGTIDLKVENQDTVTGYSSMNISNMVPGNSVAGVLTVKNAGTAPLKYYVDALASPDLKGLGATLAVKVTDGAVTGSAPARTCTGNVLSTATGFGAGMLGSAATGRLLAENGGSETICIEATLPSNASTNLQGATTDVKFTFTGTSF